MMAAEPVSSGIKALFVAAAFGFTAGSAGTYKVADDYNSTVCALRIENALNADRIRRIEGRAQEQQNGR